MGYYTDFELIATKYPGKVNGNYLSFSSDEAKEIENEIDKMYVFSEINDDRCGHNENNHLTSISAYGNSKWYDCETDMCKLSRKFPDILFSIHAEGEDRDDIWESHFLGGLCETYYATVTIKDFDENDLRNDHPPQGNGKERYSYEE